MDVWMCDGGVQPGMPPASVSNAAGERGWRF